jgi:hypothetical protein
MEIRHIFQKIGSNFFNSWFISDIVIISGLW